MLLSSSVTFLIASVIQINDHHRSK